MPELPDVEIFREYFRATALHQPISAVKIESADLLQGVTIKGLRARLPGRCFSAAIRHGKYLFCETDDGGSLVLHFGMTGFLRYFKDRDHAPDHLRLVVEFNNGYRLGYDCRRKLGRIGWTDDRKRFVRSKGLGPDPLDDDFDQEAFLRLLEKRRGSVKGLLMNQQALAGIGNIYSDEILFQAGLHPRHRVAELRCGEGKELYDCLTQVLRTAIERRVGEKGWPENWLLPHRDRGAACPVCGGEIMRRRVCGRGAYLCTKHQR